jgi:hypothetical protein
VDLRLQMSACEKFDAIGAIMSGRHWFRLQKKSTTRTAVGENLLRSFISCRVPVQFFPWPREYGPAFHQFLAGGRTPIRFKLRVTFRAEADARMVTKTALERLQARAMEIAESIQEKITPFIFEYIGCIRAFAAFECRRKHAEGPFRRHLKHHPIRKSGIERA